MSHSTLDVVDENKVVVGLEAGPKGSLRLVFDQPTFKFPREWSHQLSQSHQFVGAYAPTVIELDREKLRRLQFSQAELAEIGFSLVSRLWAAAQSSEPGDA